MESINGFNFFGLHLDANGNLQQPSELDDLQRGAAPIEATDAIFISHGFRNDENDALNLYRNFLGNLRGHLDSGRLPRLAQQKIAVAGVFWPSKKFEESFGDNGSVQALDPEAAENFEKGEARAKLEDLKATVATPEQQPKLDRAIQLLNEVKGDRNAQDEFVSCVLSLLDNTDLDPTEGVERIRDAEGSTLLDKLGPPLRNPTQTTDIGEGGVSSFDPMSFTSPQEGGVEGIRSFVQSIHGRINQFLNLTTWYTMKARSGVVGANGIAKCVRGLKSAQPNIRVHLAGHSLGGRAMAACAKSLIQDPKVQPDSMTLLEAAFSHYGFSKNNKVGASGFFRSVVDNRVVKGPIFSTFSAQDEVVGKVYAIASRLAGQNLSAIGDANDPFGGIGRNGAQQTPEAVSERLHAIGSPYQIQTNRIQCLDGSNGLIRDHSDITNPVVTYAFGCALEATLPGA